MFMEDVAEYGRIAIKIGENSLTNSYRIGDFRTLLSGMNSLIKNT